MNCPADMSVLRPIPLSGKLSDLESAAANFIRSFSWSGELLALYQGFQEPGIVGVFLVQLSPSAPEVDEWLWVVVGDFPPAYLVTDGSPTYVQAVEGYIEEMQRWVDAVREGDSVDELIPVNAPPTEEYADMLAGRLRSLKVALVDDSPVALRIRVEPDVEVDGYETVWASRRPDGTYEIDSIPLYSCDIAPGDIVRAEEVDGKLYFTTCQRKSGNSVVRIHPHNPDEQVRVPDELQRLGCEVDKWGSILTVLVPASADYATVLRLLDQGRDEQRYDIEEAVLRHEALQVAGESPLSEHRRPRDKPRPGR